MVKTISYISMVILYTKGFPFFFFYRSLHERFTDLTLQKVSRGYFDIQIQVYVNELSKQQIQDNPPKKYMMLHKLNKYAIYKLKRMYQFSLSGTHIDKPCVLKACNFSLQHLSDFLSDIGKSTESLGLVPSLGTNPYESSSSPLDFLPYDIKTCSKILRKRK